MLPAGILLQEPHPIWDSRRLWSLWEMINFGLGAFIRCLDFLDYELGIAQAFPPDLIVPEAQHSRIKSNIEKAVLPVLGKLNLNDARIASINMSSLLQLYSVRPYKYRDLSDALKRLKEDAKEASMYEYFFHYPKSVIPLARPVFEGSDVGLPWKPIVDAFPSTRREVETGIDCYALGDLSGCVFHMMRIAEVGLRAIARERGIKKVGSKKNKPIEWGTWKEVSDAIRTAINDITTKPPGPKRDIAAAFYETALDKMRFMQGLYRDPTMHFRDKYGLGETFDAMSNTLSFMRKLAEKLDAAHPNRKIRWGL